MRQKDDFWLGAGLNNLEVRADSHRGREERKGARGEERRERELGLSLCCFAVLLPAPGLKLALPHLLVVPPSLGPTVVSSLGAGY